MHKHNHLYRDDSVAIQTVIYVFEFTEAEPQPTGKHVYLWNVKKNSACSIELSFLNTQPIRF